jgi:phosphoglycerate dehydrogenase-like enzyme
MTQTIWCNALFPEDALELLTAGVAGHRLLFSQQRALSVLKAGGHDPLLDEADIAFGQPDPRQVIDSPNIKWVHLTSAGYTRYDTDAFREAMKSRGGILSNSSSVYDRPCAEHALAMILALARQLPQALDAQRGNRQWIDESLRRNSRLPDEQTILIYGFGAIARQLSQMLKPLGMKVTGVRRSPRGDEGVPIVAPEQADQLLPTTDHVVNILPMSPHTGNFFSADRLALLSPTTYFYNIGRGSTVDQDALQAMLEKQTIAGAYLDVMTPEPLPPDHVLWKLPNCWITPHTAGGHGTEFQRLVGHFLKNLKLYSSGQAILDRVA